MADNFSDEPSDDKPRASAAPFFNLSSRPPQPLAPNPEPPPIPDHELLKKIGVGSYGEVWLARSAVGTLRAVKIVWRKTFWSDHPFEREFKGIQKFEPISRDHEGLVDILQIGRGDGYFYYVMELADDVNAETPHPGPLPPGEGEPHSALEQAEARRTGERHPIAVPSPGGEGQGEGGVLIPHSVLRTPETYTPMTLDGLLRSDSHLSTPNPQSTAQRLPVAECVRIGLMLTSALGHLHRHKLVHRDVKPANVIFVGGAPKLADIGLVTETSEARSYVGTEGFIPPEGPGTPQADLYSLGKLLYEVSTGKDRHAFPELPSDLAEQSESEQLVELNAILLKACQNDVTQRYGSAEEMHADLNRLHSGKSVRRAHQFESRWRLVRRGAGWLAVAVIALTSIVLASRVWQPLATPKVEKRSTNDVANGFYRLGRHFFDKNTGNDYATAANNFKRAIEADPTFAQAYATLALTYTWSTEGWSDNRWKLLPQAKDSALKALELDNSLAEPHIALGWHMVMGEWNWKDAEQEFKRAIHLNPSGAIGYHFYADFLRMAGRTNEALTAITEALELEERSVPSNRRFTDHLVAARSYEKAIKQADQAIAMEPSTLVAAHGFRIRALCALGRYDEAIEAERKLRLLSGDSAGQVDAEIRKLKEAFATEGVKGYWRMKLEEAKKDDDSPFWLARAYAQIGETDTAITCLQAALKERDVWLTFYIMTDWTLDSLRSDPRFHAILQTMNLE